MSTSEKLALLTLRVAHTGSAWHRIGWWLGPIPVRLCRQVTACHPPSSPPFPNPRAVPDDMFHTPANSFPVLYVSFFRTPG